MVPPSSHRVSRVRRYSGSSPRISLFAYETLTPVSYTHLSPAAAEYQVARLAKANDRTEDEIRDIIKTCTDGKFLGVFGEETVNVLEFNLRLDGILK